MGRNGLSLLLTALLLLVAGCRCQDLSTLQDVVERHAELIEQLQAQIAAFNQRLAQQEGEVAFMARLTQRHATSVNGTHSTVIFDHLDLNLGGGFHTSTGIFTAPASGLYLFSLKIAHTPPGNIHVQITKEGVGIAEVEASGDDHYMDRSSADVVVRVTAGQRVWATRTGGSTTLLEGDLRSSFLGVLLKGE